MTKEELIIKLKKYATFTNRLYVERPDLQMYANAKPFHYVIAYLEGAEDGNFDNFEKGCHSILANTTSIDEIDNSMITTTSVIRRTVKQVCTLCNSEVYSNFKKKSASVD